MRRDDVVEAVVRALLRAETSLPDWVMEAILQAAERETNPVARSHLRLMLENVRVAEAEGLPLCQDTGLPIFRVQLGDRTRLDFDLAEAVSDGVRMATQEIPLRPNVVHPLTRENSLDNTGPGMPDLIVDNVEGEALKITVFPKGAGSENMSLVQMLNPADDPFEFILQAVSERAAYACPPLFLGIGIGGSFDLAARLAKRALFNMPGKTDQELDLLKRINAMGIGPMGLGGDTTALGLKIEMAGCHTASLPVAINFQCWANRSATEVLI
jgi:fumarate hydratase subunit alpha